MARTLRINHPDDRQDQQPLADLQDRGREFTYGLLLLADDSFTFLDKADRHRVGDTVGGRLIGVKDSVELRQVFLILGEQRAGQHVPQEQHDADDLMSFHPPWNNTFGQVAGIGLQGLEGPGLQGFDILIIDGGGLGEDLVCAHCCEQLGFSDAARPLLAQLSPVLPQVGHQLTQERGG